MQYGAEIEDLMRDVSILCDLLKVTPDQRGAVWKDLSAMLDVLVQD